MISVTNRALKSSQAGRLIVVSLADRTLPRAGVEAELRFEVGHRQLLLIPARVEGVVEVIAPPLNGIDGLADGEAGTFTEGELHGLAGSCEWRDVWHGRARALAAIERAVVPARCRLGSAVPRFGSPRW
jgi:hypothetical protein